MNICLLIELNLYFYKFNKVRELINKYDHKYILHLLCIYNNYDLLKFAINKYKKHLNQINEKNLTPLLISILNNNIKMSRLLLENGANANQHLLMKITPLMIATRLNNLDLIKLLIEFKADLNIIADKNYNILHFVCNPNIQLFNIKTIGNIDVLNYLLENNCYKYINMKNDYNETIFHLSVLEMNHQIFNNLIDECIPSINVIIKDKINPSILFMVIKSNNNEMLIKLFKYLNKEIFYIKNSQGETCFFELTRNSLILQFNFICSYINTNYPQILSELITLKNNKNLTCIDYILKKKNHYMLKYIHYFLSL